MNILNIEIKNPILLIIVSLFIFLNLIDMITTIFIIDGESNPIYNITGSIVPVLLIKIGICFLIVRWYIRGTFPTNFSYYFLLAILLYGCIILAFAQYINIYGIFHPSLITEASNVPAKERITNYFTIVGLIFFIPILISLVLFWLYDKSKNNIIVDKQYFKNIPWWKF